MNKLKLWIFDKFFADVHKERVDIAVETCRKNHEKKLEEIREEFEYRSRRVYSPELMEVMGDYHRGFHIGFEKANERAETLVRLVK